MLHKFLNFLFSVLSFMKTIQKVKKDKCGMCYVTGFRRYVSVLLDLIIIILFLQFCNLFVSYIFINSEEKKILSKIIAKYQLQTQISEEEKVIQGKFFKLMLLNQIAQFIILFIYVLYMWIRFAGTPGKLLLCLRVVDEQTFVKITLKQAMKRFFSIILSVIPLFLGFIWSSFDKQCQTWHDKVAGTVVVTSKSLKRRSQKNT